MSGFENCSVYSEKRGQVRFYSMERQAPLMRLIFSLIIPASDLQAFSLTVSAFVSHPILIL